jgi:hypothetical protein
VMVFFGAVLVTLAVVIHLPGALRFLLGAAGIVILILGFLLALGVKGFKVGASADGGVEASADMPTGYTRTLTISESLVEGSIPSKTGTPPPKEGVMPPKEGVMPPKGTPQG